MAGLRPGVRLDLLTGLGNGFDITRCGERPLLIGGGVGLPPMVGLCRCLMQAGKHPTVLAGFNTADEVFLREDVEKLGAPFVLATMDGSAGIKGLVTDALPEISAFSKACATTLRSDRSILFSLMSSRMRSSASAVVLPVL